MGLELTTPRQRAIVRSDAQLTEPPRSPKPSFLLDKKAEWEHLQGPFRLKLHDSAAWGGKLLVLGESRPEKVGQVAGPEGCGQDPSAGPPGLLSLLL